MLLDKRVAEYLNLNEILFSNRTSGTELLEHYLIRHLPYRERPRIIARVLAHAPKCGIHEMLCLLTHFQQIEPEKIKTTTNEIFRVQKEIGKEQLEKTKNFKSFEPVSEFFVQETVSHLNLLADDPCALMSKFDFSHPEILVFLGVWSELIKLGVNTIPLEEMQKWCAWELPMYFSGIRESYLSACMNKKDL